jgi:hypothetical protein
MNAILFRLFPSALGEGIKTLKVKDERSRSKNYTLASLGFIFIYPVQVLLWKENCHIV